MSARSRINSANGHATAVPLPVKAAPLDPIEQGAKDIVMGLIKKVGWRGVEQMIEMALPRYVASTALAEATLPHDDKLVALLGSLEKGTALVAAYMADKKPAKTASRIIT